MSVRRRGLELRQWLLILAGCSICLALSVAVLDGFAAAAENEIPESIQGAQDFVVLPSDGGYSAAYFNHTEEATEFFRSRGLRSDGETWEALVRAGLDLEWSSFASLELERSSFLDSIRFHHTTYSIMMTAPDEESTIPLAIMFARLASDPDFREQCLDHARSLGYLD